MCHSILMQSCAYPCVVSRPSSHFERSGGARARHRGMIRLMNDMSQLIILHGSANASYLFRCKCKDDSQLIICPCLLGENGFGVSGGGHKLCAYIFIQIPVTAEKCNLVKMQNFLKIVIWRNGNITNCYCLKF